MTDDAKPYHLRLTDRFAFYDIVKTNMWHEWQAGDTVTDQSMIEQLESRHAPVQRISTEFKR
jgi:hypothetical protein